MKKQLLSTKIIVLLGLFIAMSVVGGYIKIPNPVTGSIAFDSLPAYLGALVLGGVPGALIGFLGHMASSATAGFPFTIPIHLLVAFEMAIIMLVFNYIAKRTHFIVAIIVGIILNGVVAPATFIIIPGLGIAAFFSLIIPLTVASTINIFLSGLIYNYIKKTKVIKDIEGINNGL